MKTVVSFSGGKTSAYMAWWLKNHTDLDLAYVFANTGQEHPKTLEFVDRCDREWSLGVVWVEAKVAHGERVGSKANVVNFQTASRDGEPFEEVIRKYGISNHAHPHCTRELKVNPIKSATLDLVGRDYQMAIGIRVDEIDRMQADAKEKKIIYPLVSMNPTDKAKVDRFWQAQPFTLEIPPLLGNCTWCWKKTLRKHLTLIKSNPEIYDFPRRMESQYATAGAGSYERVFFRENRSTDDLFALVEQPFSAWVEGENLDLFAELDAHAGCQESCEVVL
jgi:hypothetical protein